jgi:hypothetical protein
MVTLVQAPCKRKKKTQMTQSTCVLGFDIYHASFVQHHLQHPPLLKLHCSLSATGYHMLVENREINIMAPSLPSALTHFHRASPAALQPQSYPFPQTSKLTDASDMVAP